MGGLDKKRGGWWPVVLGVALAFGVVACDKQATQQVAAPKKKAEEYKGPNVPTLPALAEGKDEVAAEEAARLAFDAKTLRNPFRPFIKLVTEKGKKKTGEVVAKRANLGPLERYPIDKLKLVGILWSNNISPIATIEDPTGKGYKVVVGTFVGDEGGKVIKITKDEVVVEDRSVDSLGEEFVNQNTLTLRKNENEVNP